MQNESNEQQREFVYHLDHADQIVAVDMPWLEFARENGAAELSREAVTNKEIWRFISDPDTRVIYRLLFDAVRTKTCVLTVNFRCDSPRVRRFMRLICSPTPRLGIELRSRILREEQRPYVSLLDAWVPRADTIVKLCAWCKKCQVSADNWLEVEAAVPLLEVFDGDQPPMVSHGMCPECHLNKIRQIRDGLHNKELNSH